MNLLETFRILSSFSPQPQSLAEAPWEQFVDWAISQGLAPLAAYNLEYRLAGGDAPEWARDQLLSVYQGTLNDSVMKLVNFRRSIAGLEGARVVLLGGAAFVESLYPHLAFRPLLGLRLLLKPANLPAVISTLAESGFKPDAAGEDGSPHRTGLSDGRTQVFLYTQLLGPTRSEAEEGLFTRALPVPVYGPSIFCPDLEDAILVECLEQARAGYDVPLLQFVDLRELLTGAPSVGGPYSRACHFEQLKERATRWGVERALYTSVALVERLFPETKHAVSPAKPNLRPLIARLLDRWLVEPLGKLPRARTVRGADRLRRLLAVGGG